MKFNDCILRPARISWINLVVFKMSTWCVLFIVVLACLTSCKKDPVKAPASAVPVPEAAIVPAPQDTIPDHAFLKVRLIKDSTNYDETMICFRHAATTAYNAGDDAIYLSGFGQEHFASVSSDNVDMAISNVPYTPGMSIRLDVHAKSSGVYELQLDYRKNIPYGIQVWLKDAYRKDSLELSHYNFYFDLYKADTASFGRGRFSLIIRPGA